MSCFLIKSKPRAPGGLVLRYWAVCRGVGPPLGVWGVRQLGPGVHGAPAHLASGGLWRGRNGVTHLTRNACGSGLQTGGPLQAGGSPAPTQVLVALLVPPQGWGGPTSSAIQTTQADPGGSPEPVAACLPTVPTAAPGQCSFYSVQAFLWQETESPRPLCPSCLKELGFGGLVTPSETPAFPGALFLHTTPLCFHLIREIFQHREMGQVCPARVS